MITKFEGGFDELYIIRRLNIIIQLRSSVFLHFQLRHLTSPVQLINTDDVITYDSCKRYDHDYLSLTSTPGCDVSFNSSSPLVDCDAWEYDRSHMIETTVTDVSCIVLLGY